MNGHHMKRQRGRGRKPGGGGGGNHPNRTLESNGPDVKVRGSAQHIYEKYLQLSRDASSAGDRVMSESYAQYAEHYFRMLRAMQPQTPVYEPQRFGHDLDYEQEEGEEAEAGAAGEEGEGAEGGEHVHTRPAYQNRQDRGQERGFRGQPYRGERQDRPERQERQERPEGAEQPAFAEQAVASEEGGEGQEGFRGNRRRRGRNRYRADGGERGPRGEGQAQEGPVEGFGDTVPAFVGNE